MSLLTAETFDAVGALDASILQEVKLPGLENHPKIFIKRDDAIHPLISGNKWRKLKYNLIEASRLGENALLTFGGAYSNHIHATAAAGKLFGIKTIGIIRGEEYDPLNPTLSAAEKMGMELHYLPRKIYRDRNNPDFQNELAEKYGAPYVVPEGGTNRFALKGVAELVDEIDVEYTRVCTAVGSGGTLAGVVCGLKGKARAVGFPALKHGEYLSGIISQLLKESGCGGYDNWELQTDFHQGGFAKVTDELIEFIMEFKRLNSIQLDYIYNGKMFFAIRKLIEEKYFSEEDVIIALHTGGLQGNEGIENRYRIRNK
ncbi:MAG: 1-aminocyclopropane-1-carboxylate deaminase/D-cysteine desulfhydrase [Chlorobi bacterium]|nr:1-aminocyclopropane-1-carboxylate deaminase/D-cysteine desulfhydrase [Chlorobiota bacterium]